MYKEKWNNLVELHSNSINEQESSIQNLWETVFVELFGYSRLCGEVESHRTLRIGSTDRVIPDIIIKEKNKDLFIVELKQHNKYFNQGMERQLFSYLKQLKISTGILVCNKLYVYNYDFSKSDEKQSRLEINFEKNDSDGIKFIELFYKGNYNEDNIKNLIEEKEKTQTNIKEIESKLTSDYVLSLIKNDLLKTYSETEIEAVIKKHNFYVSKKNSESYNQPTFNVKDKVSKTIITDDYLPTSNTNWLNKQTALTLLRQNDIEVLNNYNFASLNKSSLKYWLNPNIDAIKHDWNIILNDNKKRELHLFYISANTLNLHQLKVRSDNPALIDIQINYLSPSFIDSRSGISFNKYFIKTISY